MMRFSIKNLSHNSTVATKYVGEDQMQQGNVVRSFLFPPHQDAAITIHPGMDAFYDPASRASPTAALSLFLAAGADMRSVASMAGSAANGVGVVTLVAAEMLFAPSAWSWPRHGNAVEGRFDESLVMDVGTRHRQADGHAAGVGQDRPLDPQLTSIGGVFPGFFPRPAAPWSAPRPDSAIAMQCHAGHRNVATCASTTQRTRRVASIPGNSDGLCFPCRNSSAPPSTDIQCAGRRRYHSSPAVGSPAADRPSAIVSNWARAAECAARTHPASANYNHETPSSRKSPPCETTTCSTDFFTCTSVYKF
jgi:hypothetical protein